MTAPVDYMAWLWEANDRYWDGIDPTARQVAQAMGSHADKRTGLNIRPARSRVAAITGRSERTVSASLTILRESGWLVLVADRSRQRRPSIYRLAIPPVPEKVAPTPALVTEQPDGLRPVSDDLQDAEASMRAGSPRGCFAWGDRTEAEAMADAEALVMEGAPNWL